MNNLLARCDEVWVFGHMSLGVKVQVGIAKRMSKPVRYFDISDLPVAVMPMSEETAQEEEPSRSPAGTRLPDSPSSSSLGIWSGPVPGQVERLHAVGVVDGASERLASAVLLELQVEAGELPDELVEHALVRAAPRGRPPRAPSKPGSSLAPSSFMTRLL